jgi:cell division protein FtsI/penicillin-binding protein 2
MSSNSYNPQWYGYSSATDREIMSGSAPFVYNYLSHDSQSCITAKSLFNDSHSSMYNPDSIVRSHPGSAIIQNSIMKIHENTIKDVCNPSFQIDTNVRIDYNSFGMPNPSFS